MELDTKLENQAEASTLEYEAEMAKYGITHSAVNYFHYKDFKYTNLNDALAQAKRSKEKS